jgi:hypothetical protein
VSTKLDAPIPAKPQAHVSTEQGAACPMCRGSGSSSPQSWLAKRRGWVLLGEAAVAGTGLALGEGWGDTRRVGAAALCGALRRDDVLLHEGMSGGTQASQDQASAPAPPVAAGDAKRLVPEPEKQA